MKRILLCMGTRPEIIKMAPVFHQLVESGFDTEIVHTGQHEEMAWPIYEFFGLKPQHIIKLDRERDSLGHLGGRLLDLIDERLETIQPDAVLVHGDTSSALMAALAAYYRRIPVGHVEAGLRSFNDRDPFPEEKNRVMISRLCRWHFAPTPRAADNIAREIPAQEQIHMVGNTIVDATYYGIQKAENLYAQRLQVEGCGIASRLEQIDGSDRIILVTGHRRENWGKPIEDVARAVRNIVRQNEDIHIVWPVHLNPRVRNAVRGILGAPELESRKSRIHLTDPLAYHQMLWVLRHAWLAITDSGGIQEEAAALGLPVLVTRSATERPEVIEAGGGLLVGTDAEYIEQTVADLSGNVNRYNRMCNIDNPFGDGQAARRIAAVLASDFSTTAPASEEDHIAA